MYCKFFGFNEKPFDVTPDPTFLYLTPVCQEILATLLYGVRERRGFVVLTGEVGTGKTTLLKALLDQLDEKTKVATIFTTDVTFEELLQMVLIELDLKDPDEDVSKSEAFRRLSDFAIRLHSRRGNLVLAIDEAQNLNDRAIENLRLLSNFETRKNKLIQIVLAGQPELENKLNQPRLRNLVQRIALKCNIVPFTEKETYTYLEHRLARAGFTGSILFSRKAREMVWEYSGGVPRKINILCDKAFLIAYALRKRRVDKRIIDETIKSLGWKPSAGATKQVPPPPGPKKDKLKGFYVKPNYALFGGLVAAVGLFFVLVIIFRAATIRGEPEPARFSSSIERDHLGAAVNVNDAPELRTLAAKVLHQNDAAVENLPDMTDKTLHKDLKFTGVETSSVVNSPNHPRIQPDLSRTSAISGISIPEELVDEPGGDSFKGEQVSLHQSPGPNNTNIIEDAIQPELKALNIEKVALQVGSYQEKPIALSLLRDLLQEGYDAHVEKKHFRDGRVFYRVRVHCFQNKDDIRSMLAQLKRRGFENAFIAQGGENLLPH